LRVADTRAEAAVGAARDVFSADDLGGTHTRFRVCLC
jgi:hypothetical protein